MTIRTPSFFADAMLGKLARRLRILGYDTAYEREVCDELLIRRVLDEDRWLLTRDRYLVRRRVLRKRSTLIDSDHVSEQLREVAAALPLDLSLGADTASRCAECNGVLIQVAKDRVVSEVPAFVGIEHVRFARCPRCGKLYWPGSHWQRIQRELAGLRAETGGP